MLGYYRVKRQRLVTGVYKAVALAHFAIMAQTGSYLFLGAVMYNLTLAADKEDYLRRGVVDMHSNGTTFFQFAQHNFVKLVGYHFWGESAFSALKLGEIFFRYVFKIYQSKYLTFLLRPLCITKPFLSNRYLYKNRSG